MAYWGGPANVLNLAGVLTPGIRTVAMVNDGSNVYLYLDGTRIGTAVVTRISTMKGISFIGDPAAAFGPLHSTMVFGGQVFPYALTAQQIKILHAQAMKDFSV